MRRAIRGALHLAALAAALAACEPASVTPPPPPDAAAPTGCATDLDCDDGVFCNGAERCVPGSGDARGCVAAPRPCLRGQRCDEASARCTTICASIEDADGDGSLAPECGGDDCDDGDPLRFPGNAEVCDGARRDDDCDPATLGDRDADADGHASGACCNGAACAGDCDDARPGVHPGAPEACNGLDDDCDGAIDEGVALSGFADADGDGAGDPAEPAAACPGRGGVVAMGDDCDDTDRFRRPGLPELCDGIDNDCDGSVDEDLVAVTWFEDLDGDGFGSARASGETSCAPRPGSSLLATDCDDGDARVHPAARERCNGLDDDCNGEADFEVAPGDREDDDGDGEVDAECAGVGTDCDDRDPRRGALEPEACDGADQDCDGRVDEGTAASIWLRDADGDGYGSVAGGAVAACSEPDGFVSRGGDCDDADASRHPGAAEGCDHVDGDCDGEIDEACAGPGG